MDNPPINKLDFAIKMMLVIVIIVLIISVIMALLGSAIGTIPDPDRVTRAL